MALSAPAGAGRRGGHAALLNRPARAPHRTACPRCREQALGFDWDLGQTGVAPVNIELSSMRPGRCRSPRRSSRNAARYDAGLSVAKPPRVNAVPLQQVSCEGSAELQGPAADRLVADLDAALRQHLLDIPHAEGESEVESDGQPDDVRRKSVAIEGDRRHARPSTLSKLTRSATLFSREILVTRHRQKTL